MKPPSLPANSAETLLQEPREHGAIGHDALYTSVPAELKGLRAWLPFRIEIRPNQDGQKKLKVPYNIADRKADYTDSGEWMTFEVALTMCRRGGYDGLGIVIDKRFGIVGYDADSCISDGVISPWALDHVATLDSYTELSVSGRGLHCLAYGELPAKGRRSGGFEMYCDRRYFVITGRHLPGTPGHIERRPAQIIAVHTAIFAEKLCHSLTTEIGSGVTQSPPNTQVWVEGVSTKEPCGTQFPLPRTQSNLGGDQQSELHSDEKILRLLKRDPVAWTYFSAGPGTKNPSLADFALGCKLAFYTGGCLRQMHRLFLQSALADRAKCATTRRGVDYVNYTLERCLTHQKVFWRPSETMSKPPMPVGRPFSTTTHRVLEAHSQNPNARAFEIALTLGLKPFTVRKVLSRYC